MERNDDTMKMSDTIENFIRELFVDDKFVTKFFITEKESYVFCPEIMDLHIEYNFKLILNENRK